LAQDNEIGSKGGSGRNREEYSEHYRSGDRGGSEQYSEPSRGGQQAWRGFDDDRQEPARGWGHAQEPYGREEFSRDSQYGMGRDAWDNERRGRTGPDDRERRAGSRSGRWSANEQPDDYGRYGWRQPQGEEYYGQRHGLDPYGNPGYPGRAAGYSGGIGESWQQPGRGQGRSPGVQWDRDDRYGSGHRGKGPRSYTRSDDRITEDVNDRLTQEDDIDASEIDVKVSDGEVTLNGAVDSKRCKRFAEDCADSVSGVKHVQNNLRISSHSDKQSQGAGSSSSTKSSG
jgi:hypothetical protein